MRAETPEPMSGAVLRSAGLTMPRVIRLGRSHNKEEPVCDADEDAIDGDPTESPVKVRRASHVVDDDPSILLAHEHHKDTIAEPDALLAKKDKALSMANNTVTRLTTATGAAGYCSCLEPNCKWTETGFDMCVYLRSTQ
jgi:hypothetical protein